jgi:hypothetical protein
MLTTVMRISDQESRIRNVRPVHIYSAPYRIPVPNGYLMQNERADKKVFKHYKLAIVGAYRLTPLHVNTVRPQLFLETVPSTN